MPCHPATAASMCIFATILTMGVLGSYALWEVHSPSKKRSRVRQKLPRNLDTWREPGNSWEAEEQIWINLDEVFRNAGIALWRNVFCSTLVAPGDSYPLSSGFGYVIPTRADLNGPGSAKRLRRFDYTNPLQRAARTRDGHDVIIRVVVVGNEGHDHLKILRRIATGKDSLLNNNHTRPMLAEFQFEDITFGIFPKVGGTAWHTHDYWAKNSVGDIIEMLMQMLEALAFIHALNIAHRDAFRDNFVTQWHPESLATMKISPSRPRVYLIDFEVAIQFPSECPADQRLTTGYPLGGSFTDPKTYARPHAPEFITGRTYCPFKLDVWQLGQSLEFKSKIPAIDEILVHMTDHNPDGRMTAAKILDQLKKVVHSMPPESLLIEPMVVND